jgi:polyhydroxybutyrate depolymerase
MSKIPRRYLQPTQPNQINNNKKAGCGAQRSKKYLFRSSQAGRKVRRKMRLLALLLLSTASALFNVTRLPAGTSTHTITSGGRTRTFIVNKGSGVGDSNPAGLVVLFHGFTQTASQMCSQANAASIASTNKFISVCAQGLSNSWNAGACCGTAQLQNIDDVSFAKDIVKYVSGASKVDASKVSKNA